MSVLLKVKFSVTDGATIMKCAIDNLSEWCTEMSGITNHIWIHCTDLIVPQALKTPIYKY